MTGIDDPNFLNFFRFPRLKQILLEPFLELKKHSPFLRILAMLKRDLFLVWHVIQSLDTRFRSNHVSNILSKSIIVLLTYLRIVACLLPALANNIPQKILPRLMMPLQESINGRTPFCFEVNLRTKKEIYGIRHMTFVKQNCSQRS